MRKAGRKIARNGWMLSDQVKKGPCTPEQRVGLYSQDSGEAARLVKEGTDTIRSAYLKVKSGCHGVDSLERKGGKRDAGLYFCHHSFLVCKIEIIASS